MTEITNKIHDVVLMRSTEVDVIIEDGSMLLGILQKACHLWTNHWVEGEEGAEEHDVVRLDVGSGKLQLIVRMILVEDVVGIVVVIEESQRQRRLRVREDAHVVSIHAIVSQKLNHVFSDAVVACLTDEDLCSLLRGIAFLYANEKIISLFWK